MGGSPPGHTNWDYRVVDLEDRGPPWDVRAVLRFVPRWSWAGSPPSWPENKIRPVPASLAFWDSAHAVLASSLSV